MLLIVLHALSPQEEKRDNEGFQNTFSSAITEFDSHEADTAAPLDAEKTVLGGYITSSATCGQPHLGNFRRAKPNLTELLKVEAA